MQWYFTSDWHLNHANIIKYCNRPFLSVHEKELLEFSNKGLIPLKSIRISSESVDRMNNSIIEATNSVVSQDDNLVILGDFCWSSTPRDKLSELVSKLRCKNLYLVWGNHDNRQTFLPFFKRTYDHYLFTIEGQKIFASHYPCRSWPNSSYGSWMVYGHVHNRLSHQDDGLLSTAEKHNLTCIVKNSLEKAYPGRTDEPSLESMILEIGSVFRKPLLSLDVGVDNIREDVPFGTPWSFQEIKSHMEKKISFKGTTS